MFKVYWDNGRSACGTFPEVFDTYEEAEDFGQTWADERNLEDLGTAEPTDGDCYTFDVIELKNGRWESVG